MWVPYLESCKNRNDYRHFLKKSHKREMGAWNFTKIMLKDGSLLLYAYAKFQPVTIKFVFFLIAYSSDLAADPNKKTTPDTKNFLACPISWNLFFLGDNKFIYFYSCSMISRERVMWKFQKKSQISCYVWTVFRNWNVYTRDSEVRENELCGRGVSEIAWEF